ncbi:helix-turn-helix domain-containing protein [Streptomyces decoyicus]|uniref:helix-turn-helix domain-containing protein n=1 Tax=Streptomyces decoyicus TaxID=249567 RepID=UPI0036536211
MTEVHVLGQPLAFGSELRRLRIDADLTLTGLASKVHYSKGQLSKVETGRQQPSPELARLCDAVLEAGGTLIALVQARPARSRLPAGPAGIAGSTISPNPTEGEVWPVTPEAAKPGGEALLGRRTIVTEGAASLLSLGVGGPATAAHVEGAPLLDAARQLFDHFRTLGQTAGPHVVLPALAAQTRSLCNVAAIAGPRTRQALLVIGSRYAEYAGWMAQESGDDAGALWWTDQAVALAKAGGDEHLATYALVRRALITFYAEDVEETVNLARKAIEAAPPPRIAGLAAQQEAQGHALAGDYTACMRSLDRARHYLARADADPSVPTIGTRHISDPVTMVTGWCLYDLGRPRQAAEILDRETSTIPAQALRNQARYGVRRALAHVGAGQVDHACALVRGLLGTAGLVGSATIATDLRRVARALSRYRTHRAVRELTPDLTRALHPAAHGRTNI